MLMFYHLNVTLLFGHFFLYVCLCAFTTKIHFVLLRLKHKKARMENWKKKDNELSTKKGTKFFLNFRIDFHRPWFQTTLTISCTFSGLCSWWHSLFLSLSVFFLVFLCLPAQMWTGQKKQHRYIHKRYRVLTMHTFFVGCCCCLCSGLYDERGNDWISNKIDKKMQYSIYRVVGHALIWRSVCWKTNSSDDNGSNKAYTRSKSKGWDKRAFWLWLNGVIFILWAILLMNQVQRWSGFQFKSNFISYKSSSKYKQSENIFWAHFNR